VELPAPRLVCYAPRAVRILPLLVLAVARVASAGFTDVFDVAPLANASRQAPGPRRFGLPGLQIDPSSIDDFDGTVALAYFTGKATDGTGVSHPLTADMRVFRGAYVARDGTRKDGTFGFI
jgi:hypothetical protein